MEKLIVKLEEIVLLLKIRDNESYHFFEEILSLIKNGEENQAINNILSSGAIIQYGDFDYLQEKKFKELYNVAKEVEKD
jgi:hypothetical protein